MGANPSLMTGLGAAFSIFLSAIGASAASVPAGIFAQRCKDHVFKAFIPIVIAGVLGIYGIIISVILAGKLGPSGAEMTEIEGYKNFSSGLAVGLACMASGMGLSAFVNRSMNEPPFFSPRPPPPPPQGEALLAPPAPHPVQPGSPPKVTTKFVLCLVYLEAIGLYGLIVALVLAS